MGRKERIVRPEGGETEVVNPDAGSLLDDGRWRGDGPPPASMPRNPDAGSPEDDGSWERSQDRTGFWD